MEGNDQTVEAATPAAAGAAIHGASTANGTTSSAREPATAAAPTAAPNGGSAPAVATSAGIAWPQHDPSAARAAVADKVALEGTVDHLKNARSAALVLFAVAFSAVAAFTSVDDRDLLAATARVPLPIFDAAVPLDMFFMFSALLVAVITVALYGPIVEIPRLVAERVNISGRGPDAARKELPSWGAIEFMVVHIADDGKAQTFVRRVAAAAISVVAFIGVPAAQLYVCARIWNASSEIVRWAVLAAGCVTTLAVFAALCSIWLELGYWRDKNAETPERTSWDGFVMKPLAVGLLGAAAFGGGIYFLCPRYDFEGAYLAGLNLHGRDFRGANFAEADLTAVELNRAHLEGADFSRARLALAQLKHAHLNGATFDDAILRSATLRDADLSGASLVGAKLDHVDLRDAVMGGVTWTGAEGEAVLGTSNVCVSYRDGEPVAPVERCGYLARFEAAHCAWLRSDTLLDEVPSWVRGTLPDRPDAADGRRCMQEADRTNREIAALSVGARARVPSVAGASVAVTSGASVVAPAGVAAP